MFQSISESPHVHVNSIHVWISWNPSRPLSATTPHILHDSNRLRRQYGRRPDHGDAPGCDARGQRKRPLQHAHCLRVQPRHGRRGGDGPGAGHADLDARVIHRDDLQKALPRDVAAAAERKTASQVRRPVIRLVDAPQLVDKRQVRRLDAADGSGVACRTAMNGRRRQRHRRGRSAAITATTRFRG